MIGTITWLGFATGAVAQFGIKHTQYETSPPVYPSPNITGAGDWDAALKKAHNFLDQLTLGEKAGIVTGTYGPCVGNIVPIPRLNFKGLCLQDGPLAVRQAVYTSVFPGQVTVAASFDRSLARKRAEYLGQEFRGKGAHIALGPVIGAMGRSPYGGRNWEAFSPDSYLSGEMVFETVQGIQSAGVQATTKHFIANEQETQRQPTVAADGTTIEAVSSNVDDKTMHETYLWPFANAVRAGTASIMGPYSRLNGSYGCQNSKALNGLLKTELGYQGYVMSDWGAVHSGVASIKAGLDMNMPGGINLQKSDPSYFGSNITIAVNNGSLPIERVNDMVLRVMTPYFHLGQDKNFPPIDEYTPKFRYQTAPTPLDHLYTMGPVVDVRKQKTNDLIRELGAAGTVLLKNTNGVLPLKKPMNVGVFGNDAADLTDGASSLIFAKTGILGGEHDIGTLTVGGGSGGGRNTYLVSPLEAIKQRAHAYGALVQYITNNDAIVRGYLAGIAPPPEVCLVFLKTYATEGKDRTSLLAEWSSTEVVTKVTAICQNTVVVLHGAAPNVLPWANNPNVTAIIAAHMPGQETGNSIVDILWGDVNPSGKLPYTIANREEDYNRNLLNDTALRTTTDPDAWQEDFVEGNLIDYKEFDAKNASVLYEFGFGLSYTTFALSDLDVRVDVKNAPRRPDSRAPILPGGNADLWKNLASVSVSVKNSGKVSGSAVPQVYLTYPDEAGAPVKSLRGFEKVELRAGAKKTVKFSLTRRDLSYWNTITQDWTLPQGKILVNVGFSSRNLPLKREISI